MKIYAIYTKSDSIESFKDIVVVQKSFNMWAAVLNFWWALYKRQFFVAIVLFLFLTLIGRLYVIGLVDDVVQSLILIYVMFVVGIEAGNIIGSNLVRKNYMYQELVVAKNVLDAKYQFSKNFSRR